MSLDLRTSAPLPPHAPSLRLGRSAAARVHRARHVNNPLGARWARTVCVVSKPFTIRSTPSLRCSSKGIVFLEVNVVAKLGVEGFLETVLLAQNLRLLFLERAHLAPPKTPSLSTYHHPTSQTSSRGLAHWRRGRWVKSSRGARSPCRSVSQSPSAGALPPSRFPVSRSIHPARTAPGDIHQQPKSVPFSSIQQTGEVPAWLSFLAVPTTGEPSSSVGRARERE